MERSAVAPDLSRAHRRAAGRSDRRGARVLRVSPLKVGVIGAGAWGKNHVRTLAGMADVELSAVCDAPIPRHAGALRAVSRCASREREPGGYSAQRVDAVVLRRHRRDACRGCAPVHRCGSRGWSRSRSRCPPRTPEAMAQRAAEATFRCSCRAPACLPPGGRAPAHALMRSGSIGTSIICTGSG